MDRGRRGGTARQDVDGLLFGFILHHGNPGMRRVLSFEAAPSCADTHEHETSDTWFTSVATMNTTGFHCNLTVWHEVVVAPSLHTDLVAKSIDWCLQARGSPDKQEGCRYFPGPELLCFVRDTAL